MRRLGLIGLGVISRFYVAALNQVPSFRLVAACDPDEAALAPLRGTVRCYEDHHQLLAAEDLDAVVVTVPNDRHAQVCHDALDAGVSVCVEKPLANRLEDGVRLLEHARDRGLTVFTAFHRRYNAAVGALLAGLPTGNPVVSVTVRYLERIEEHTGQDGWYLDPARCGGGCVADNGPNAYDLVRLLLGQCRVADTTIVRDTRGIDRWASVDLAAADGARGRIELDWSYPGQRKEVEIQLADNTVRHADMLAGYDGLKASLWHEYISVLSAFDRQLSKDTPATDPGLSALAFTTSAYRMERTGEVQ